MSRFRPSYNYDLLYYPEAENFDKILVNESVYDHQFKGVFHFLSNNLKLLIANSSGKILKRIIKEDILDTPKTLVFPRNHRFFEAFNQKIERIVPSGIIVDHFNDDIYRNLINPKQFKHLYLDQETPMALEHLEAGFVVWLVSLVFPIIAFIGEWIARFMDFIVFRSVFTAYIKSLERNVRNRDRKLQKFLMKMEKVKQESLQLCDQEY
jgi:hypothetical protein